jgi:hypothetical protein
MMERVSHELRISKAHRAHLVVRGPLGAPWRSGQASPILFTWKRFGAHSARPPHRTTRSAG